ncbi:MAG: carbohydrate ABC transporter permease [Clostridiales bacterium]|jgi:multiple sugar transport system permease protein|nr:carbohydrate ABC transporter permease [Clostridiales bacterium]
MTAKGMPAPRIVSKSKGLPGSMLFHAVCLALGFLMVYPLLWLLASSMKNGSEIFTTALSLWPKTWAVFENYSSGWRGIGGVGFETFMLNSLIVSVVGTVLGVASSLMAAYAFTRIKFRLSGFWFACVMATLMIPGQVMVVPQYIIFRALGIINTLVSLAAPWMFGSAFFIFLIAQFFRGLPIELDEAAEMDGCGKISTLILIYLPLSAPAAATSCIFSFYWIWQDFFQPLIFINDPKKFTVPLALNLYTDPNSYSNYGGLFAMSVVSLLPVVLFFILFQKHLVEGIATTGLKG